jgi:rod shape determining protein RodA
LPNRAFSRDLEVWILLAALVLSAVGVSMVYSATQSRSQVLGGLYIRQMVWVALGLLALAVAAAVPFRYLEAFAYPLYGISILLLVGVLFIPGSARAHRWYRLGPVLFQPSEIAKIATAFALAKYLAQRKGPFRSLFNMAIPLGIVGLPMILVLIEPDLGTSLSFLIMLFAVLFWDGVSSLYLFFLFAPLLSIVFAMANSMVLWGALAIGLVILFYVYRVPVRDIIAISSATTVLGLLASVVWGAMKDYQKMRLLVFMNPGHDPRGAGWHLLQSKVAIGSGGLLGKGFLQGTQKRLAFLPEQHTDFIFSTIGEELGFLRAALLLILFFILIYRGVVVAREARNRFASLVAMGLVAVIGFHVFLNVGMTLGIMPVTGIPLPFLSYGGSPLLAMMLMVGVLVNIGLRRYEY